MKPSRPFRWLSPAGHRGRLSTFIFHRVLEREDPLRPGEPDIRRFDRLIAFIARHYEVMPLPDAVSRQAAGRLPAAAAAVTFDDGYADNLLLAAPILQRHGVTATVFVSTAYIDGGRMWNDSVIEAARLAPAGDLDWRDLGLGRHTVSDDASRLAVVRETLPRLKYAPPRRRTEVAAEIARRAGLPTASDLMLTREQLKRWRSLGFDVGGHTVTHPILARTGDAEAAQEIGEGRAQLTQWLGEAPRAFAYPNGVPGRDYGPRDVALVRRAGYDCAVSTAWGAATRACDPYQMPRFMPWDRTLWAFGLRCARTLVEQRQLAAVHAANEHMEVCP